MNLSELGWDANWDTIWRGLSRDDLVPARIMSERRERYIAQGADGEMTAEVSGRLRHRAESRADFPAAGDWVGIDQTSNNHGVVQLVLPRRSCFARKAVLGGSKRESGGLTDAQVLAANIDYVFLVSGLDQDFKTRRIERYLAIAWDSGATPIIILNKIDLRDDVESVVAEVEEIAVGVQVLAVSGNQKIGIDAIGEYLTNGRTGVFLGSSGVGKSTIINTLLGTQMQSTQDVREFDGKGRHTTTSRDLFLLPTGGIVIDTPGLKVIQATSDDDGLSLVFEDIESLSMNCKFRDCSHKDEPGCAVTEAISAGELDPARYQNYIKLQKEARFSEIRNDEKERRSEERAFSKKIKQYFKARDGLKKDGLL